MESSCWEWKRWSEIWGTKDQVMKIYSQATEDQEKKFLCPKSPRASNMTRVQRPARRPVWLKRQNSREKCQKHAGAGGPVNVMVSVWQWDCCWSTAAHTGLGLLQTRVFLDAVLRAHGTTTAGLWNKGSRLTCSHTNDNLTNTIRQSGTEALWELRDPGRHLQKPWWSLRSRTAFWEGRSMQTLPNGVTDCTTHSPTAKQWWGGAMPTHAPEADPQTMVLPTDPDTTRGGSSSSPALGNETVLADQEAQWKDAWGTWQDTPWWPLKHTSCYRPSSVQRQLHDIASQSLTVVSAFCPLGIWQEPQLTATLWQAYHEPSLWIQHSEPATIPPVWGWRYPSVQESSKDWSLPARNSLLEIGVGGCSFKY